jgi:transcriptional regulator with XRE-family HTH domain
VAKSLRSDAQILFRGLMIDARRAAGLTQVQLAETLGRPQSFVAKYETGERRIDVVEFVAILQALGTDPHPLLARLVTEVAGQGTETPSPRPKRALRR